MNCMTAEDNARQARFPSPLQDSAETVDSVRVAEALLLILAGQHVDRELLCQRFEVPFHGLVAESRGPPEERVSYGHDPDIITAFPKTPHRLIEILLPSRVPVLDRARDPGWTFHGWYNPGRSIPGWNDRGCVWFTPRQNIDQRGADNRFRHGRARRSGR